MKVLFLLGDAAVGKMTVGQELMKITNMRLFHNHMMIEPVIEIFGRFNAPAIGRLRDVVFEEFAASDGYGLIFTYLMAFDMRSDWEYLEHVKEIFRQRDENAAFYYAELTASKEIRLARNVTENRLKNKPSKRDLAASRQRLLRDDENHRCESVDGEIPFENYIKINNSCLTPDKVARMIKDAFGL